MNHAKLYDRLACLGLWSLALGLLVIPLMIAGDLIQQGWPQLSWQFLLSSPSDAGRGGGIAPLIISTGLILLICLSLVMPLGLSCALFLSEHPNRQAPLVKALQLSLDVLSAIPSIIYGLFGYVFFAQILGFGFSILAGGLALGCMALPLFIRLAEQALSYSPASYRQAAQALGLSHIGFIVRILLPSAAGGLAAATIVATGRALAETAVLIFTAGYVTRYPESLFDSGRALSLHIYDLATNVTGGSGAAAATALVLVALLILINLSARALSRRWQSQ